MDFTKDWEDVLSEVSGEKPDIQKIKSFLQDVKIEHGFLTGRITKVNHEAADKRHENEDLEQKLKENELEIGKLKDNSDYTDLKTNYDKLTQKHSKFIDQQKQGFAKQFEEISTNTAFEKIKDKLIIPLKDDKLDLDELTEDDIINNVAKINEYKELGIFGLTPKPPFNGAANVKKLNYDDKELDDLAKNNPKEYEKLRKQKGFY